MRSPIPDYLDEVLDACSSDRSGHVADYIPELASADPDVHALAISTVDGSVYDVGGRDHQFTIQSICKPFVYALAIDDIGLDRVLEAVGVEPSGEAFNEMSLEGGTGRPYNPMINAGAIASHQLVRTDVWEPDPASPTEEHRTEGVRRRVARVLGGLSAFAARDLEIDYDTADDEFASAHRNMAIAHMLRNHDIITNPPAEAVRGYIDVCSALVTVGDIALMAATLANSGTNPITGARVVSPTAARQTLSVMATCGMYDGSGRWLAQIGIPAKSGVSGGIIGVLPGQVGLASFSPRLDEVGNSVQGVQMFQRLSADMGLHLMSNEQPSNTAVRWIGTVDDTTMSYTDDGTVGDGGDPGDAVLPDDGAPPMGLRTKVVLQGTLRFSGAERTLRAVVDAWESGELLEQIELNLARVDSISGAGVRMIRELVRRLERDDRQVVVVDPDRLLTD
ncbi:MAG: glutaminase A [Nesterenkonia sp.]|nr:glutaminase A [Nesterenkonia sp.]